MLNYQASAAKSKVQELPMLLLTIFRSGPLTLPLETSDNVKSWLKVGTMPKTSFGMPPIPIFWKLISELTIALQLSGLKSVFSISCP